MKRRTVSITKKWLSAVHMEIRCWNELGAVRNFSEITSALSGWALRLSDLQLNLCAFTGQRWVVITSFIYIFLLQKVEIKSVMCTTHLTKQVFSIFSIHCFHCFPLLFCCMPYNYINTLFIYLNVVFSLYNHNYPLLLYFLRLYFSFFISLNVVFSLSNY